jgi:2-hydroxychromene-2-carboxylate isomerase
MSASRAHEGIHRAAPGLDGRMTRSFAVTFDYRCPYARIAHDHIVTGLRGGADWDVTFLPFSLGQVHVEEGRPSVWEQPSQDSGIVAMQASIAVRDTQPERFVDAHHAVFRHRHVHAGDLRSREALSDVLARHRVDVPAVWDEVDSGRPLATIEKEHTAFAESHRVWGVPTFVVGDSAAFVRLLAPADDDPELAVRTVERLLDQIEWPLLNELKHTSIPR